MPDDAGLHDRDWYAWTQDQAARLRAWPEHLRPNGLDVEEVAQEIESLGKSDRRAITSFLRLIALHALKMEFHPVTEFAGHWRKEIGNFRDELGRLFEESPSLFAQREALFAKAWRDARRELARDLGVDAPEAARAFAAAVPAEGPPRYDLDAQVLNEDWYPAPPAP
ncbi:DUF29 domain-containing protein [Paracraurococcus lichenis]|uniref:DUF29 domain-containing protein n=1 Tax=Paracraurococcus lichenis TaxID=3064888 RepID=A0ABT9DWB9_9PROT|nr:DUF29 domain-containing protein [Paracraurococcus sp. LOR1-02]MDO9708200.1 DUF29 domain-containing protein [Paracraurococcus sp. LOR1-02]